MKSAGRRKAPGGRPPKSPEQRHVVVKQFRVTPFDFFFLEEAAQRNHLTLSDFIKRRVFHQPMPPPLPGLNILLKHQLSRVKSNLTQIKRALLSGHIHDIDVHLLNHMRAQTDTIRNRLQSPKSIHRAYTTRPHSHGIKTKIIKIHLTLSEWEKLDHLVSRRPLSFSEFIRQAAVGYAVTEIVPAIHRKTLQKLRMVQRRLNKIAHGINGRRLRWFNPIIFSEFDILYKQVHQELDGSSDRGGR